MSQSLTCRPLFNSLLAMRRIIFLIPCLLFWCQSVQAAVIDGLYEAEVPVPDQSAENHKKGLSEAMLDVLVKLTGDSNVQGRQVAEYLTGEAEKYVQQYKYRNKPVIRENQLTLDQQLYLWVSFNPQALDQALQKYDIPQWGKVRPATLVWLLVQDGQERKFIGLEDDAGYTAIMESQAQARGIALLHPLLDSQDRSLLQEADVRGGFMGPVREASRRYTPDAILVGNVLHTDDGMWEAEWTYLMNDEQKTWAVDGDQADVVLKDGINQLTDILASRYVQAVAYGYQESGIEITVKDINDFDQYSKVLKYLRTLNSVTSVDVKTVEPGSVTFLVASTGGELVIQRAIELGSLLQSMTGTGSPYRLTR